MLKQNSFQTRLLLLLIIIDVVYSFIQHFHSSLDGDIAAVILPTEFYSHVLKDPFGWSVIWDNEIYAASNRFFIHWSMVEYFRNVPFLFQYFTDPISSVYLSCALAKTFIQVSIVLILAFYIYKFSSSIKKSFLIAVILIVPLMQTCGYNGPMGIIDHSITYTFFYAFSIGLLLIFLWPFYKKFYVQETGEFTWGIHIYLLLLLIILPFSGPLIPGIILIVCPSVLLYQWWIHFKMNTQGTLIKRFMVALHSIPKPVLFYFIVFCFLCLYSMYIGTNNIENQTGKTLLISDRYSRIPIGIYSLLTQKLGFPLLLLMITLNVYMIRQDKHNKEGEKIIYLLKWVGFFSVIYILLLPLGGYRDYRSNILRRDTIMPVIIGLIFIYGLSTYFLLTHINQKYKKAYNVCVIIFILIFTVADNPNTDGNRCEKASLEHIANSPEKIVLVGNDCNVMSWIKIEDYKNSETNTRMLEYWEIIKEKKFYYQK